MTQMTFANHLFDKYFVVSFAHGLSDSMDRRGFTTYTAAYHQRADRVFCLYISAVFPNPDPRPPCPACCRCLSAPAHLIHVMSSSSDSVLFIGFRRDSEHLQGRGVGGPGLRNTALVELSYFPSLYTVKGQKMEMCIPHDVQRRLLTCCEKEAHVTFSFTQQRSSVPYVHHYSNGLRVKPC